MQKPEDEDINPNSDTYAKLLDLAGGVKSLIFYVSFLLF